MPRTSSRIKTQPQRFKIESKQQQKQQQKQKQTEKLQKKIQKRQVELVKEIVQPPDYSKELKVIRDSNNNIYKDLYVDLNEHLTKLIRLTIQEFPDDFLPPIFKGSVPIYIEKAPMEIKQTVLLSKLINGDYQSKTSKSDKGIGDGIRTLLKIPELKKYDQDDLTNFVKNHREVFYHILLKTKNQQLSLPTFKSYIVKLMRVLFLALKGKTQPTYIKYASLMKDLMSATQAIDAQNSLNDNEKTRFLDWNTVLQTQKSLQLTFNSLVNKKTKNAYDFHLDHLIVSLYTLTPVLRREPMTLQFKKPGDDIKDNYVNVRRNEVILELNEIKKKHDAIEIKCNDDLAAILRESLELYPRKYLFTDARRYPDMSKPVKEDTVAKRLNRIFLSFGVNIGPSILRSSYVTYRFDSVNGNLRNVQVEEMAKLMRTSAKYIYSSYRKITDKPHVEIGVASVVRDNDGKAVVNDGNIPTAKVVSVSQPTPVPVVKIEKDKEKVDPYVVHNEKIKKKYKENEEYRQKTLSQQSDYRKQVGQHELQKRKVISMLRNSVEYRKKVKQTTLDKYGIKLSDYSV